MKEINESAFRSDLRALASAGPETTPPPDFLRRARGFKSRRRHRVAVSVAAAVLGVAGASTGLAYTLGGSQAEPPAGSPVRAAPVCPGTAPRFTTLPSGRSGLSQHLVPHPSASGTACTYQAGSLLKSQSLSGAKLKAVVAALDRPVAAYPFRCPTSPEPVLLIEFGYAEGPEVHVLIATNCPYITNGVLSGALNRQGTLPPEVSQLLP